MSHDTYDYAVYDQGTGRIDRVINCPTDQVGLQVGDGEAAVLCFEVGVVADDTHYVDVDSAQILPRRALEPNVQLANMEMTITNIPAGSVVNAHGTELVADDDGVVFDTELPSYGFVIIDAGAEYQTWIEEVAIDE
ncbi:hypothetical protein KUW00_15560 [Halomonas sp. DP5N14-9]|uniref:hypothetical protein n=1 Tax=Halomonas sp. DP5N14-9 TaxID=2859075 RepID=UPI001C99A1C7|nr:hypothetical protein [Halomonas sp. DP5N14-9]MBY5942296.1 hypothetical protein [Halomonas sp. DP5N14-9]